MGVNDGGCDVARQYISQALKVILIGGPLLATSIASAAPFPPPLLGRSITVSWTVDYEMKRESNGETFFHNQDRTLQVYISTAGRAFSNEVFSGRSSVAGDRSRDRTPRARNSQQAPDDGRDSMGRTSRIANFEGGALVVDSALVEGARRLSITFDAGSGSCNARVIMGREGGAGSIRQNLIMDGIAEVVSSKISTPRCSVADGNVLGGH
jgi:hypothetical protein